MRRFAVVLAGGRGERFWPLSRPGRPKQLMPLPGGSTLLARTYERLCPFFPPADVFVVTGRDLAGAVRDALPLLPGENVLEEPAGRNTAAAVALAALFLEWREPGCAFGVFPADHHIGDVPAFHAALARAFDAAASGALVTFGIRPTRPATGYGYICPKAGEFGPAATIEAFREKPDAQTARALCAEGRWLWNSGMFVWRAQAVLDALRRHAPDVLEPLERLSAPRFGCSDFPEALERAYTMIPSISIDRAVMERTDRGAVVEVAFDWDDLGAWDAFAARFTGTSNSVFVDSPASVAFSTDPDHTIAVLGLPGVVVVHTSDATLVLPRERADEVRRVVQALDARGAGRPS
jgi:mannose-1-phosphate guanylyltransferase